MLVGSHNHATQTMDCMNHSHHHYTNTVIWEKIRSVQYFEQTFFVRKLEIWKIQTLGKIEISDTWPQYVKRWKRGRTVEVDQFEYCSVLSP